MDVSKLKTPSGTIAGPLLVDEVAWIITTRGPAVLHHDAWILTSDPDDHARVYEVAYKLTPEQAKRLASPEVTAARALLVQLQHEDLLTAIRHDGNMGSEQTAAEHAAGYVWHRIASHVSRGTRLVGSAAPVDPADRPAWERLTKAVEAAGAPKSE